MSIAYACRLPWWKTGVHMREIIDDLSAVISRITPRLHGHAAPGQRQQYQRNFKKATAIMSLATFKLMKPNRVPPECVDELAQDPLTDMVFNLCTNAREVANDRHTIKLISAAIHESPDGMWPIELPKGACPTITQGRQALKALLCLLLPEGANVENHEGFGSFTSRLLCCGLPWRRSQTPANYNPCFDWKLSASKILDAHGTLFQGATIDQDGTPFQAGGQVRTQAVTLDPFGTFPTPQLWSTTSPHVLVAALQESEDEYNARIAADVENPNGDGNDFGSCIEGACSLFRDVVCNIHPFLNGNGRIGRILLSYCLIKMACFPVPLYCAGRGKAAPHYLWIPKHPPASGKMEAWVVECAHYWANFMENNDN